MAVAVSHGGANVFASKSRSDELLVGTRGGVVLLQRTGSDWQVTSRALESVHISALALDRPHLVLRREPNVTFNISNYFRGGGAKQPSQPGRPGAPLQLSATVSDGTVEVINAYSYVKIGRAFSILHVNARAALAQGRISSGILNASISSGGRSSQSFWPKPRRPVFAVSCSTRSAP